MSNNNEAGLGILLAALLFVCCNGFKMDDNKKMYTDILIQAMQNDTTKNDPITFTKKAITEYNDFIYKKEENKE